MIDVTLWLYL